MNTEDSNQLRYEQARKQVRRIKGFYTHAVVYLVINAALLLPKVVAVYSSEDRSLSLNSFSTLFFWGIGLVAHGLSVFVPTMVLGRNWEERKIKELMDDEAKNKWE